MTRPKNELPKLRRHKAKNCAYFRFRRRQHYCGTWGTDEAEATYRRKLAEIVLPTLGLDQSGPPEPPVVPPSAVLVEDLAADYMEYVERRYAPPSKEPETIWYAVRALLELYGPTRLTDFRPRALQTYLRTLVHAGLARTTVNRRLFCVRRMFLWGVGQEMVPSTLSHALHAIEPLRRGELGVREGKTVQCATFDQVAAVLPHLGRQVAAIVCVQWLTGMRPGEVVSMRKADLHQQDGNYYYRPPQHKNVHRGKDREIEILPEVMSFLAPFLLRPDEAYLFDPRDADAEQRADKARRRKSKVTPSQRLRHERKLASWKSRIGERYSTASYRRALDRACKAAGLTARGRAFSPHQIRHAAATLVASRVGMVPAAKALGHATIKTTERYTHLERDVARPAFEALAQDAVRLRGALGASVPSRSSLPSSGGEARESGEQ